MNEMHEFYDVTLASMNVPYVENYIRTSFGRTHSLLVGDPGKPRICTIHGGNGITTLNLKLFLPLLKDFSIIAHGPVMPMLSNMVVPFIKYYFHPTVKGLNGVIQCMGGQGIQKSKGNI